MEQRMELTCLNPAQQIALKHRRTVSILEPVPGPLFPEVYKGNLVYRAQGSSKRIFDTQIKKGLVKKKTFVKHKVPDRL